MRRGQRFTAPLTNMRAIFDIIPVSADSPPTLGCRHWVVARATQLSLRDLRCSLVDAGIGDRRVAIGSRRQVDVASRATAIRDVRSILDAHYLHRDQALAESAIRKLEIGYAIKTGTNFSK